jgi:arylsulfatase
MSMRISRRNLIKAGMISAASLSACSDNRPVLSLPTTKAKQPNILLVVTDQERAIDNLPKEVSLPARNYLAQRGVSFPKAQVVSSICSVSRGTLYTGQHPQHNNVWENTPLPYASNLSKTIPTLGTMMQDLGYTTAYFGKWHLSKLPMDETVGFQEMSSMLASYGFEVSDQDRELDGALEGHRYDPATTASAQNFIRRNKQSDKPWFASVNLVNPHDIMFFAVNEKQRASRWGKFPSSLESAPELPAYQQKFNAPLDATFAQENWASRPSNHKSYADIISGVLGELDWTDTAAWQRFQDYYFNCLQDVDTNITALCDTLTATDSWENTIVVFTSDHGEMLGAHHLRDKGPVMYKECNNVPMIVVHPEGQANQTSPSLTSHIDIAPTLLEFAGLDSLAINKHYPQLKGHSFASAMKSPAKTSARNAALYQWSSMVYLDPSFAKTSQTILDKPQATDILSKFSQGKLSLDLFQRGHLRGIFDGRYKFGRYFSPRLYRQHYSFEQLITECDLELYDTVNDRAESNNLATNIEEHRTLIIDLNSKLEALITTEIGTDIGGHLPGPTLFWQA